MSTTVQLVNRLRRRFREEDVTALVSTDDLSNFAIDLLNEAMRDLLESYTWEFDKRTDGELFTKAPQSDVPVNVSVNDSELYVLHPTWTATQELDFLIGKHRAITSAIVTTDPDIPDTAIRLQSYVDSRRSFFYSDQPSASWGFPGTTNATATATFVFDEYVLPTTVRAVTSVRHQEQDLQVIEVDRDVGLDAWAPRPHGDLASQPERVFIGKYGTSTYRYERPREDTPDGRYRTGMTMKLDPTPNAQLVLSYSYVYRHPALSATQDLAGVDPVVEDLIVRLAEARGTMSGLGADVQTGAAMETEVLNRARAVHGNSRRDPLRRVVIQPTVGGRSSPFGFGRLPRNFGTL